RGDPGRQGFKMKRQEIRRGPGQALLAPTARAVRNPSSSKTTGFLLRGCLLTDPCRDLRSARVRWLRKTIMDSRMNGASASTWSRQVPTLVIGIDGIGEPPPHKLS